MLITPSTNNLCRYLISQGADKDALTDEEEKAVDLVDPEDFKTTAVLLNTQESVEKERRMSTAPPGLAKREPAWFRRESMQRDSVMESGFKMSKVRCRLLIDPKIFWKPVV